MAEIFRTKKAISNYSKAVGNIQGEAALMTYFVECGNDYTLNYGDIDEPFYDVKYVSKCYRKGLKTS